MARKRPAGAHGAGATASASAMFGQKKDGETRGREKKSRREERDEKKRWRKPLKIQRGRRMKEEEQT